MSRVIVIGAGWAGLVAAKTYLEVEPRVELTIIDNDSTLGGTWSKDRLYPNLLAEAHYGLFEYSDHAMSPDGIQRDGCIPGHAIHRYLDEYAEKFDLKRRLRLSSKVTHVERDSVNKIWSLRIENCEDSLLCEKLIIATGLTSQPFLPDIPRCDFKGEVLHTKVLGLPETIERVQKPEVKRVLVYGGSKSAFDAVHLLVRLGKKVEWVIRPGNGPSIMTPLRIFGNPTFRLSNSRCMGLFSPNVFDLSSSWNSFAHGPGSSIIARKCIKTFWMVMAYLTLRSANYSKSKNGRLLQPELGLMSLFWSSATLGVMTHPELWKDIHSGDAITVHRKEIDRMSATATQFTDGSTTQNDMVVFATGWKTEHSIFSNEQRLAYGLPSSHEGDLDCRLEWQKLEDETETQVQSLLPLLKEMPTIASHTRNQSTNTTPYRLYRHIAPATSIGQDHSIAFVGMLRTTGAPIVFEAQALWAVAYLTRNLNIPSKKKMEEEVALTNAWIRRRYICGHKVPFALFDFMAYIDLLYKDLGLNSRRKANLILETFGLYEPKDFNGVVSEFLNSAGRKVTGMDCKTGNKSQRIGKEATASRPVSLISIAFFAALVGSCLALMIGPFTSKLNA